MHVWAMGQDRYWLETVQRALDDPALAKIVDCPGSVADCLDRLPPAEDRALLLVDASGQHDIVRIVQALRDAGWRYVVVAAADPSVKEARAILRGGLGYDYWKKTYATSVVRSDILRGVEEILHSENGP
jgi:hypothetical protein